MTKEEEASIVKYCNDNGVNYKARLSELGVPEPTLTKLLRLVAKSRQIATNQNKIATRTSPEACVFSPYFADTYGGKGCDLIKFPINQGHFFDFAKSS